MSPCGMIGLSQIDAGGRLPHVWEAPLLPSRVGNLTLQREEVCVGKHALFPTILGHESMFFFLRPLNGILSHSKIFLDGLIRPQKKNTKLGRQKWFVFFSPISAGTQRFAKGAGPTGPTSLFMVLNRSSSTWKTIPSTFQLPFFSL